ncbi:MAG: hypothetical protein JJU13_19080 [Balneolaceae bacterium]|nr:hypothetical protein [Balneolaceae bacterium]
MSLLTGRGRSAVMITIQWMIASIGSLHYIVLMKTIYVDTSVFGGTFDEEFGYWTQRFFEQVIASNIKLLKSDVVDDELTGAPEFVLDFVDSLPDKIIQHIDLSEDAIFLGE